MLYIGKIVSAHGIKGEIKVKSSFKEKDLVFKPKNKIYINNQEFTINTYRVHKKLDMLTFDGFTNINEVLPFIGSNIYLKREEINAELESDFIGCVAIFEDKEIGFVKDLVNNSKYNLLLIKNDNKEFYIPLLDNFILKKDLPNKKIILQNVRGLIDEN
jgi:16S rRNA processing protein RimM